MAVPAPDLSVVIAVVSGFKPALRCIRSIQKDAGNREVEIVAVLSEPFDFGQEVTTLEAPRDCSEREKRALGKSAARGRSIAVVGDRYEVQPGWVNAALSSGPNATAGMVGAPARLSAAGWAIYLAEYSHVMVDPASVPMGNVVNGDDVANFRRDPALLVTFASPPGLTEYAAQRYESSRAWAAEHSAGWIPARRRFAALTRVTLPALLLWRRGRNVVAARQYQGRFLFALPYLLVFGVIEAAGEIAGFVLRRDPPACPPRF